MLLAFAKLGDFGNPSSKLEEREYKVLQLLFQSPYDAHFSRIEKSIFILCDPQLVMPFQQIQAEARPLARPVPNGRKTTGDLF
jgi:hypothetical protein